MIRGMLIGLMITALIIFIGNFDRVEHQQIEQGRTIIRMICITVFIVSLCTLIGSYLN